MSPKVSAVLELARDLSDDELKDVRLQLELDAGAAALGRKLPRVAPEIARSIQDELEYRLEHPLPGAGVSPEVAIKRARQTLATMRKRKNPKK